MLYCRKQLKHFLKIRRLKQSIARSRKDLNVVIGSAGITQTGWIATNIDVFDIIKESDWKRLFSGLAVNRLVAEHVWEHLTPEDAYLAAKNCYHFLKKSGFLRVAVPDGYHPDKSYIDYVKPGGNGPGCDDHKMLYNYLFLSRLFQEAGFDVNLLEWWDENGKFHFCQWKPEDGFIHRSMRFDRRNKEKPLSYTSLILDAVKR